MRHHYSLVRLSVRRIVHCTEDFMCTKTKYDIMLPYRS